MITDTIHSYVRLKPEAGESVIDIANDSKTVYLTNSKDSFQFEHAFGPESTNEEVYKITTANMVSSAIKGYNCCVFAYGQTSSGKTYTIKGNEQSQGLVSLVLADIYNIDKEKYAYEVWVSYMEIYNEMVNDLLNGVNGNNLVVRQNDNKETVVTDLLEFECGTLQSAISCLQKGQSIRKYGKTQMNNQSSRSHVIYKIRLRTSERGKFTLNESVINVVDLAGSQGVLRTKAEGATKKEGENINKSLLTLSKVIRSLGQKSSDKHISFRDSKLTRILQSSLGGQCMTSVICTINTSKENIYETVNTLKFGVSAGHVKVIPKLNILGLSNERHPSGDTKQLLQRHESKHQQNQKTIDQLIQLVDDYKIQLSNKQSQIVELKMATEADSKKIEQKDIQLAFLKRKIVNRDRDMASLEAQGKIYEGMMNQFEASKQGVSEHQTRIRALKEQNDELAKRIGKYEHNEAQYIKQINDLKAQQKSALSTHNPDRRKELVEARQQRSKQQTVQSPSNLQNLMKSMVEIIEKNKQIRNLEARLQAAELLSNDQKCFDLAAQDDNQVMSKHKIKKFRHNYEQLRRNQSRYVILWRQTSQKLRNVEAQLRKYQYPAELQLKEDTSQGSVSGVEATE